MKRVAGFVELFTQKVPAVRVGHNKYNLRIMNAEILVFIEHKFFVNSFTISLFWGNILEKRYPMKYKRILLKISGEALLGDQQFGIDQKPVRMIAEEIEKARKLGAEVAVVVGGGNIFRGMKNSAKLGMDQASGDYVGMLATVMNAVALQSTLNQMDIPCRIQSAIAMNQIAEPYIRYRAIRHLEKGRVVIFAAGTGNPFFTTDTAAALRASEINAEAMLMAKNGVDGVYTDDPKTNPNAKKLDKITYDDIIINGLKVMDTSACALCKQNNIPIVVFDFDAKDGITDILNGKEIGTYIN